MYVTILQRERTECDVHTGAGRVGRNRGGPSPCSTLRDVTGMLDELLGSLDAQRAAVLSKLAGLGEDDARRSTVPSGTNLAGPLQL